MYFIFTQGCWYINWLVNYFEMNDSYISQNHSTVQSSWLHFNRVELGYLSQTSGHAPQQMVLNILTISNHKMDLYVTHKKINNKIIRYLYFTHNNIQQLLYYIITEVDVRKIHELLYCTHIRRYPQENTFYNRHFINEIVFKIRIQFTYIF